MALLSSEFLFSDQDESYITRLLIDRSLCYTRSAKIQLTAKEFTMLPKSWIQFHPVWRDRNAAIAKGFLIDIEKQSVCFLLKWSHSRVCVCVCVYIQKVYRKNIWYSRLWFYFVPISFSPPDGICFIWILRAISLPEASSFPLASTREHVYEISRLRYRNYVSTTL